MRHISAADYHHLYGLKAWQNARQVQFARQPLCERCLRDEIVTEANVVNHRVKHLGDWALFIDPDNHESVCQQHHDGLIRREEARGYEIGSDINGRPLAADHPWNQG
jgi:5-methylcytosine-specific restriction enzyme A